MSECTLYVLDAPRVKSQEAAAILIAKRADWEERAANIKIESFLAELLQTYPGISNDDKSIWYEGFANNAPNGPVLALVFKLALFDAQALRTVRTIAEKHALHLFDEEAHVLYLANGKKIGVGGGNKDPIAALNGATRSAGGLRYNGVYVAALGKNFSYYRFTPDREMFRQSLLTTAPPKRAFLQMVQGDPFVAHGPYKIDGGHIVGKVRSPNGVILVEAKIDGDAVSLTSVAANGAYRFSAVFQFEELEGKATEAIKQN